VSRTCDQQIAGSNPGRRADECNLGKLFTHTCASVIQHQQYNLVPANGLVPNGLVSFQLMLGGWGDNGLPRTGISPGSLRSFPVRDYLYGLFRTYGRVYVPYVRAVGLHAGSLYRALMPVATA